MLWISDGGGTEDDPVSAVTERQDSKAPVTLLLECVPSLWCPSSLRPSKSWGVRIVTQSLEKEFLRKLERERQRNSVFSMFVLGEEEGRK